MSWLVLVASGVPEAVWAIALDRSDGFSRPTPSVVFLVALALSMGGLGMPCASFRSAPPTPSGWPSGPC